MNIYINENIRKLRREKNITQEKLAEHLNVSTQAVSKWERNESFPDMTMIIPIASYFGVTTDELFGFDAAKNEAIIQAYLKELHKLLPRGQWNEAKELITKAQKEFPNDFRIMIQYMYLIIGGRADNPPEVIGSYADELTMLCERILNECTVDDIRRDAVIIQAKVFKAQGNIEKAIELLGTFPDWYNTKNQAIEQLFDKDTPEFRAQVKANFNELTNFAHNKLLKIIWYSDNSFDEKLADCQRIIKSIEPLSGLIDELPLLHLIQLTYSEIGRQSFIAGRYDEATEYFDIGLNYAEKIAALDENSVLTHGMLSWYENNPWLDELRKHDSFNEMIAQHKNKLLQSF